MKLLLRLAVIACLVTVAADPTIACQCGATFHGMNALEVAKLDAQGSSVIFEGTPERFELKWSLLNAKEGELIPVENPFYLPGHEPQMLITFKVQNAYKGAPGTEVQVTTGLGGGDCGAVFMTGLTYLVFSYGTTVADLRVSMCSPGGWVGRSEVATELRYLRKERPVASDLIVDRVLNPKEYAALEPKRKRDFAEYHQRYDAVTGKICGTVIGEQIKGGYSGAISFLSTAGYSPFVFPDAAVGADGSFCSFPLGPGKYYLLFTKGSDTGETNTAYYPGVGDLTKASTIEIGAGQTQSGIAFNVPVRKTYSVRGIVSTNDKSGLDADSVSISLLNLDGISSTGFYDKTIDFRGSFPLPKVKYFDFENVVPGRYVAVVSVSGQGWYTKKVEVNVTTHMKFISLELIHKKQ